MLYLIWVVDIVLGAPNTAEYGSFEYLSFSECQLVILGNCTAAGAVGTYFATWIA